MYAPTVYFPLIVEQALMIEPTVSKTKASLDEFIEGMLEIAREAESSPETLKKAPHNTVVGRLDETLAARHPVVRWQGRQDTEDKTRDE